MKTTYTKRVKAGTYVVNHYGSLFVLKHMPDVEGQLKWYVQGVGFDVENHIDVLWYTKAEAVMMITDIDPKAL